VTTLATNPTRVLLVSAQNAEVKSLGGPLARDRTSVTRAKSAAEATDTLARGGFDALILSLPLPDADAVGACAAVSAVAGCPPILLIDHVDRSREVLGALPLSQRPVLCLARPVDGGKLPDLVRDMLRADDGPDPTVDRRGFACVLLDLASRGDTGALEVRCAGVVTRIFVRRGAPISVEGGSLRETLGRILVRRGALSERDYERVIRRMTERPIDNEHQRMGEVLIQLGLMRPADVFEALSAQAAEKLKACFATERAELIFHEMEALPASIEPLAVPPFPALLVEIVKLHFSEEEQSALVAKVAGSRMRLRQPAPELRLAGEDARIVASLNGSRSLGEVWRENPGGRAALAALVLTDALEIIPTEARRTPGPTPAPPASAEFARDVVVPRQRAPRVPEAPAGDGSNAVRRSAGVPGHEGKSRLEAEQLFTASRKLLEREKFDEASALLQRVVALLPEEPEYRMLEAWASYLAARVAQRIARAKAVACARKMLEIDARAARPHTILGRLLLDDGDAAGAIKELELALVRDPADEEARKALSLARGAKAAPV
jgi:hypothetical protein